MDACTLSKFFRSVTFGMTAVWLSSAVVGRAQSATQQGITAEDATAKSSSSHLREGSLSTLVHVPTHLIPGAAAV